MKGEISKKTILHYLCYQQKTVAVPILLQTTILNNSGFPPGIFIFFYGVDLNPDNLLDTPLYSDLVIVIVQ